MPDEITTQETIAEPAPVVEGEKKADAKGKVRKRQVKRQYTIVRRGNAYIQATYNNTIITLTDPNGSTLAWSSAGLLGFRGPKKATPYAASLIVKDVIEKTKPYGLKEVTVFVRGVGSGRESAVRALNANGMNVLAIKDMTPIPHNGPRAPRPRRV